MIRMESQLLHHGTYQLIKLKTGEMVVRTDLLLIMKEKNYPEKTRMPITVRRLICIHHPQDIMIPTQLTLQTRKKLKKQEMQVKKAIRDGEIADIKSAAAANKQLEGKKEETKESKKAEKQAKEDEKKTMEANEKK